jgi:hypothetical protein
LAVLRGVFALLEATVNGNESSFAEVLADEVRR